jgi:uncharacterized OB-fold protein
VHSFTVLHRAGRPEFAERVPYVVALTETEEGVRLVTNLVEVESSDVQIGMAVEVTFEDIGGLAVPQFRPAA